MNWFLWLCHPNVYSSYFSEFDGCVSVWHTLIAVDNSGAEGVGVRWGPFSTVKLFLYIENISIIFAAIILLFVLVPNIHMFTLQFSKDVAYLRI